MASTSTSTASHSNSNSSNNRCLNSRRAQSIKTFLASDEPLTIIPSFTYKQPLDFLLTQTNVGPFIAGSHTIVPLWLGLYLRKRNLCRLVAPYWMDVDYLKKVLHFERSTENAQLGTKLPFRYTEISRAILSSIGADRSQIHASASGSDSLEIPNADQVKVLLEDIGQVRMSRLQESIKMISKSFMTEQKPMPVVDVTGIGAVEMEAIRPFLIKTFENHFQIALSGNITPKGTVAARNQTSDSTSGRDSNQDENSDNPSAAVRRSRIRRFR